MRKIIIGLALLTCFFQAAMAGDIYVWKDAQGRIQYTQFPPVGLDAIKQSQSAEPGKDPAGGVSKNLSKTPSVKGVKRGYNPFESDVVIPVTVSTATSNVEFEKKIPTFAFLLDTKKLKSATNEKGVILSDKPAADQPQLPETGQDVKKESEESKALKLSQCEIARDNLKGLEGDAPVVTRDASTGELKELTTDAKNAARIEAQKGIDFYCKDQPAPNI